MRRPRVYREAGRWVVEPSRVPGRRAFFATRSLARAYIVGMIAADVETIKRMLPKAKP